MRLPANIFATLTKTSAYHLRPLLRAREFERFCKDRGEAIDVRRLRKLEQLGLFKPLLRVRRPDYDLKIETLDDGRYRDLGPLGEGEAWSGETRKQLAEFSFRPETVESWRQQALIWSPIDETSDWEEEIDADPERHEAYFSEFQIWDLKWVLSQLTLRVSADNAVDASGAPNGDHDNLGDLTVQMISEALKRQSSLRFRAAYAVFAQLISDRFYVETQTDQRLMTITMSVTWRDWEWRNYARTWTPDSAVAAFRLDKNESAELASQLDVEQRAANPMDAWRALTRFVAVSDRKRLKDKALLAETLGEMAEMHRRFHKAAFGEALPDPHEMGFRVEATPPVSAADDPYRALEWVTNAFHLNPKPRLVLIVEGQTEEAIIPEIFERYFGAPAARFGVQLRNMHGVGNATGSKRDGMSALWRLVDFLHAQQTIALVLLDREGLASRNVERGLRRAPSIHFADRYVTRREYVKLWNRCFELDNFSNRELASAMSTLSGVAIAGAQLAPCRPSPTAKVKPEPLDAAYRRLTGESLNKIALARTLTETMFDSAARRPLNARPIIRFLSFAADRAGRNHQPTTFDIWEDNQRSGHFGALKPGAASRRRYRRPRSPKP